MRIIGLTGGIASGKSTVSSLLAGLGAAIIDTDVIARQVVAPDEPAWRDIVAWLGEGILQPDRTINRARLGDLVFSDSEARRRLEEITHHRIKEKALAHLAKLRRDGAGAAVLDAPLLYEAGWDKLVDEVWVVYAGPDIQLARLMSRDKLSRGQAAARMAAQMSLTEKARLADVVIDNSTDIATTEKQVAEAWNKTAAISRVLP